MEFLDLLLTVGGYAAAPAAVTAWIFQRWRSGRRNAADRCAGCGDSWSANASGERYLVHGRLLCKACGARARRRLSWQLGALGGVALFSSTTVLLTGDPVFFALLPPALVAVAGIGGVGLMKLRNRQARERIEAGTYPFLPTHEQWNLVDPEQLLSP